MSMGSASLRQLPMLICICFGICLASVSLDLNSDSCSLVGRSSWSRRYATSSKLDFSTRSAMSYPRYMRRPLAPSMFDILVSATGMPLSPMFFVSTPPWPRACLLNLGRGARRGPAGPAAAPGEAGRIRSGAGPAVAPPPRPAACAPCGAVCFGRCPNYLYRLVKTS